MTLTFSFHLHFDNPLFPSILGTFPIPLISWCPFVSQSVKKKKTRRFVLHFTSRISYLGDHIIFFLPLFLSLRLPFPSNRNTFCLPTTTFVSWSMPGCLRRQTLILFMFPWHFGCTMALMQEDIYYFFRLLSFFHFQCIRIIKRMILEFCVWWWILRWLVCSLSHRESCWLTCANPKAGPLSGDVHQFINYIIPLKYTP